MTSYRLRVASLTLVAIAAFVAATLAGWAVRNHMGDSLSQDHPSALDTYTDWLFPIFVGAVILAVWAHYFIKMHGSKPRLLKYLAYLTLGVTGPAIVATFILLALVTTDNPLVWG